LTTDKKIKGYLDKSRSTSYHNFETKSKQFISKNWLL